MDPEIPTGLGAPDAETEAGPENLNRPPPRRLPSQIGPYHIIELLGQGGMGAVYLAEQTQPFRRRVALKVIKPGMDSDQVIARFETERQALALMNHPNVARVLDAGTTDEGRPYFVMEHVAGIPITEYCDKHTLNTAERLKLFLSVCGAVQHAHQKGIIHRDLKPSNVLVGLQDDVPVPKVIDFGVAKAVEQRLTDKTLFTAFGQLVGTPEYMSPEQAEMSMLDIDTRSDIYSLGVLLYELLVGALPFERKALRRAAAREVKRISQFLTGLFEVSDPAEGLGREVTARELLDKGASSIESLKDQPVAQATLMDTMGHVYFTLGLYDRAASLLESAITIRRQQLGADSLDLASSIFNLAEVRIERGDSQESERLAREALRIREKQLPANHLDVARSVTMMAVVTHEAQHLDQSERYYKRAIEILRQTPGDNAVELAGAQNDLATLYQDKADYPKALELYRESVRVRRARLGDTHPQTVQVIVNMAGTLQLAGRYTEAEPLYREGLATQRKVYGNEHPLVATTVGNLGLVEHELHNEREAEKLFREAIDIQRKRFGESYLGVAISTSGLAKALQGQRRYEEAERLFRHSISIERSVDGDKHPAVGVDTSNLAECLMDMKRHAEAETLLLDAERSLIASSGENHPRVAKTRRRLARLYRAFGKPDVAAKYEPS